MDVERCGYCSSPHSMRFLGIIWSGALLNELCPNEEFWNRNYELCYHQQLKTVARILTIKRYYFRCAIDAASGLRLSVYVSFFVIIFILHDATMLARQVDRFRRELLSDIYLNRSFVHSLGFDTDWFVFSEAVSFNSSLCVLGTVVSQRRRAYRLVPPSIKVIPINIRSLFISSIFHCFVDFNLIFCVCILSFFFASYMDFGVSVASLCSFSTLEIISTRKKIDTKK